MWQKVSWKSVNSWASHVFNTECLFVSFRLCIHSVFVLPTFYFLLVRRNPFTIFRSVAKALMTALLISSRWELIFVGFQIPRFFLASSYQQWTNEGSVLCQSAATLPITLQCCEDKLKADKRICRFMLPIATSINMNGTALYEVVAAIFLAQLSNIKLNIGQIISIG